MERARRNHRLSPAERARGIEGHTSHTLLESSRVSRSRLSSRPHRAAPKTALVPRQARQCDKPRNRQHPSHITPAVSRPRYVTSTRDHVPCVTHRQRRCLGSVPKAESSSRPDVVPRPPLLHHHQTTDTNTGSTAPPPPPPSAAAVRILRQAPEAA